MRVRAFAIAAAAGLLLAGCANVGGGAVSSDAMPGEPFDYPTHCGVGQVDAGGTTYFPTAVYDGDEPVTGADPSWYTSAGGPTPWITVVDNRVVYANGAADMNMTHGTLELFEADGAAIFHVTGGRWSIHLSDDPADAAWTIEGCA